MLTTVLTALIAVVGTLAGASVNGYIQARTARVQREDTHRRTQQDNAVTAVADVVAALDKHRGVMVSTEKRRLNGGADEVDTEETRTSRAELSGPLTRLCLLVPALAECAREAAFHTYAIRACPDLDHLEMRRQHAHTATTRLVDTAAKLFAGAGIGLALPAAPSTDS